MKKIFLLTISLASLFISIAQPGFQWVKSLGENTQPTVFSRSTAIDAAGNVYTAGFMKNGTADFDPGAGVFNLSFSVTGAMFISKLDAAGNFVWAKKLGGPANSNPIAVTTDAAGNVYSTGAFEGTGDFDPGAGVFNLTSVDDFNTSQYDPDIFICKLDANGNFAWAKSIGNRFFDAGTDIAVDAAGNVYTTGEYQFPVDFDPGAGVFTLPGNGGTGSVHFGAFVLKLDTDGNFGWARLLGQGITPNTAGNAITLDAAGNVYTTGDFTGFGADFDPGAGSFILADVAGNHAMFVSKLDAIGNFVWAKALYGDGNPSFAEAIKTDAAGNVYTSGLFSGQVDFDPGAAIYSLASNGGLTDGFILKLDALGNFAWAQHMGSSSGDDQANDITVDAAGNVYTIGEFSQTSDFDAGPAVFNLSPANNSYDIFISKVDAAGNFLWAINIGGNFGDKGQSLAVDGAGFIYATGMYSGTVDFNPGPGVNNLVPVSAGGLFVLKLAPSVAGALDVKWLSFTGKNNGSSNLLEWSTATELNNDHFDIERSSNGISFEKIGIVKGSGNSSTPLHYQAADNHPLGGNNYYRLRQTDIDGKYAYSVVIIVANGAAKNGVKLYPNPCKDNLTINLGSVVDNVQITISDMTGKIISESAYRQQQLIPLKMRGAAGLYFIKVSKGNTVISMQQVVMQ